MNIVRKETLDVCKHGLWSTEKIIENRSICNADGVLTIRRRLLGAIKAQIEDLIDSGNAFDLHIDRTHEIIETPTYAEFTVFDKANSTRRRKVVFLVEEWEQLVT